jgi:hypothetical protein
MNDDQFEDLMRDAARTYNRPLELPRTEELWTAIERTLPASAERPTLSVLRGGEPAAPPLVVRRASRWTNPWLRTAAVLALGVALGRASVRRDGAPATPAAVRTTTIGAPATSDVPRSDQIATSEYLGETAALLSALPSELRATRSDPAYLSRADALLLQTRLLLDSPAASDPALRSLFDDLEVVLAQVVRLHTNRDQTRIDLLNDALQQRDVLPRLRDAVAENAAD